MDSNYKTNQLCDNIGVMSGADGTYDYGPASLNIDQLNSIRTKEQASIFAYFPTFRGLVKYRDQKGMGQATITRYKFKNGGNQENDWLPELDSPEGKTIESSAEILVLRRNFQAESRRELLCTDVLKPLTNPLAYSLISHIEMTDPDAKKISGGMLLIDDMIDTDNGPVLFLRLGKKVLCPSAIGKGFTPMINRTALYRLDVRSGEVFKYKGNMYDYTLKNVNNWERNTTI